MEMDLLAFVVHSILLLKKLRMAHRNLKLPHQEKLKYLLVFDPYKNTILIPMKITHFKTKAEFRKWLEKNHGKELELWVGFHKKNSLKPSITYPQALDEALCYGWIDGVRKNVNETSYTIRFTPRKKQSH